MKKIFLLSLLIIGIAAKGSSQHPPWYFINTAVENTHVVLVLPNVPILLDDQPMEVGDYIGAFYEFSDTLLCGTGTGNTGDIGGMMIDSVVAAATVWGADPNVNNGFQLGEEFKWKVWRASDGSVFDAIASYNVNLPGISDSAYFVGNGLSALESLTAYSIPGIDLSVNKQVSPISGCGSLADQDVSIVLENHDSLDIIGFTVNFTLNQGDTVSEYVNDTIFAGFTYDYTFNQKVTLQYVGDYDFHVWVDFPGDVNYTNDYNNKLVIISDNPEMDLGDDRYLCDGDSLILQTDDFFEEYLWSNGNTMQFLITQEPGLYFCTITDENNCQTFDSVSVNLIELPTFELTDTVWFCDGENAGVEIPGRFNNFQWSNGTTHEWLFISIPGQYMVTVTDFAGCQKVDSVQAIERPLPAINFDDSIAYCMGSSALVEVDDHYANYQWSTQEVSESIYISTPGVFSLTVTDVFGCVGEDEFVAVSTPIPTVYLGDTIYSDILDTILIDAGEGMSEYYWNTGETSQIITPSTYGVFDVSVWKNNCEASAKIVIRQDTIKYFDHIHVWPNPTQGELTFYLPKTDEIRIEIYDMLGHRLLEELQEADNIMHFNIQGLRSGIYFVRVKTDDQVFEERIIKL